MPRKLPPFVYCEFTRHGRRVFYFRRGHGPRVRLPDYGSDGFDAAYAAALSGMPIAPPRQPGQHSLAFLIGLYKQSLAFAALSKATRRQRDNIFANLAAAVGHEPYAGFTASGIQKSLDRRAATPSQARNIHDALRGLYGWAKSAGLVSANPTDGVILPKRPKRSQGFLPWTEELVARYRACWPLGTRQRVWLEVILNTGLRRGDAVLFGRQHVKAGTGTLKTEKTGMEVAIPLNADFLAAIEAGPTGDLTFIAGQGGLPLTKESFGNLFRAAANAAGCQGYSAHGLRKLAATRIAEAGASVAELEALFGWEGGAMASLYTKSANRRRLAAQAMERLANTQIPHHPAGAGLPPKNVANSDR